MRARRAGVRWRWRGGRAALERTHLAGSSSTAHQGSAWRLAVAGWAEVLASTSGSVETSGRWLRAAAVVVTLAAEVRTWRRRARAAARLAGASSAAATLTRLQALVRLLSQV